MCETDQNSDWNTFGRINELWIISIFEDHIFLMFMKKNRTRKTSPDNRGPDNQGSTVLYSRSSLTKCNRHSCKWTALLTAAFTKPHFNSHTNSVFLNPHKRLQIFLGFLSSIFALMSLNIRNEISFHHWMKTCENAVKNMWNTLWQGNTLWKNLWILHSLNFDKISKFRTLWKNLWLK